MRLVLLGAPGAGKGDAGRPAEGAGGVRPRLDGGHLQEEPGGEDTLEKF